MAFHPRSLATTNRISVDLFFLQLLRCFNSLRNRCQIQRQHFLEVGFPFGYLRVTAPKVLAATFRVLVRPSMFLIPRHSSDALI